MNTIQMIITPEQARGLLGNNEGNRALRNSWVAYLASCIERGEWLVTHQGIAITADGRLLDGQHRLQAIIAAGKAVPMLVTFDADPETFRVLDQGATRSNGDVLRLNLNQVALATLLHRWMADDLSAMHRSLKISPVQVMAAYKLFQPTINEVIAVAPERTKRANAPLRLAVVARVLCGHGAYAIPTYRAFAHLDYPNMPPIIQSMTRQITDGAASMKRVDADSTVRMWLALDPSKADITKVQYRDRAAHIDDIRAALRRPMLRAAA